MTSVARTEPEHGSVQLWGSKKTNLSHLLNFHFEPRDLYGRGGSSRVRYRKGWSRNFQGHATKYNKEHFLQAKYVILNILNYLHKSLPRILRTDFIIYNFSNTTFERQILC